MSNERVQKLEEKIAQLKAQKEAILARERQKERKARTRLLIQIGGVMVKYFNLETPHQTEAFCQRIKESKLVENLHKELKEE